MDAPGVKDPSHMTSVQRPTTAQFQPFRARLALQSAWPETTPGFMPSPTQLVCGDPFRTTSTLGWREPGRSNLIHPGMLIQSLLIPTIRLTLLLAAGKPTKARSQS